MTNEFSAVWNSFIQEVDARNLRLRKEVEAVCRDIDALVREALKRFSDEFSLEPPKANVPEILKALDGKSSELLFKPVHAFRKARIPERFLNSMDSLQSGMEDVLRLLPATMVISREELGGCLSAKTNL